MAQRSRPTRLLVMIGRLNYKVHLEEGMICSERAVVEGASVNKYQYACSSVNNNCIIISPMCIRRIENKSKRTICSDFADPTLMSVATHLKMPRKRCDQRVEKR